MLKSELDKDLQDIAHENFQFKNWANTFQCRPELLFTPQTEQQVVKVIKKRKPLPKQTDPPIDNTPLTLFFSYLFLLIT